MLTSCSTRRGSNSPRAEDGGFHGDQHAIGQLIEDLADHSIDEAEFLRRVEPKIVAPSAE